MRATKLLAELNVLTPGQLQEFHFWLDQFSYDEAQAKLHQKHKIFISTGRLARYYQALDLSQDIAASTDLDFQIQDYVNLVNGEPLDFDAAGMHRIKKRVFELTLDPKTKPSVLPILFRILTYNDTLALRQQRAQIQERRVALEERKQQWRESLESGNASPLSQNTPSTEPHPHSPGGQPTPASPRRTLDCNGSSPLSQNSSTSEPFADSPTDSRTPASPCLPLPASPRLPVPPPVTCDPARSAVVEAATPSVSRPPIHYPTLREWYAKLATPCPVIAKPSPVARALAASPAAFPMVPAPKPGSPSAAATPASHPKRTGPPTQKRAPNPHEHDLSTHFPISFSTAAT